MPISVTLRSAARCGAARHQSTASHRVLRPPDGDDLNVIRGGIPGRSNAPADGRAVRAGVADQTVAGLVDGVSLGRRSRAARSAIPPGRRHPPAPRVDQREQFADVAVGSAAESGNSPSRPRRWQRWSPPAGRRRCDDQHTSGPHDDLHPEGRLQPDGHDVAVGVAQLEEAGIGPVARWAPPGPPRCSPSRPPGSGRTGAVSGAPIRSPLTKPSLYPVHGQVPVFLNFHVLVKDLPRMTCVPSGMVTSSISTATTLQSAGHGHFQRGRARSPGQRGGGGQGSAPGTGWAAAWRSRRQGSVGASVSHAKVMQEVTSIEKTSSRRKDFLHRFRTSSTGPGLAPPGRC